MKKTLGCGSSYFRQNTTIDMMRGEIVSYTPNRQIPSSDSCTGTREIEHDAKIYKHRSATHSRHSDLWTNRKVFQGGDIHVSLCSKWQYARNGKLLFG